MTDTVDESPITFTYLRKFNISMAVLHFIQGVAMIALGFLIEFDRDLYTNYLTFQLVDADNFFANIFPQNEVFFTFDFVGVWVASFLILSALAHTLIAGPLFDRYKRDLAQGINRVRWFEYALSSSVMIVMMAVLFGVLDFWLLFAIFFLNAMMNLFGYSMELQNMGKEKVDWTNYIFGWIAGIATWVIIASYFYNISSVGGEGAPAFVYWIFWIEILIFNSFAFNMLLQYLKVGKWKDYLYGERVYQILSLVAKSLLAWLVFAGLFQPN